MSPMVRGSSRGRTAGLWASVALAAVGALTAAWIAWPLPADLLEPPATPSLVLEDRNGVPLRTVRDAEGALRTWVPLAEIDPRLIQAFVALEDRRFYDHSGVDLHAIARATRDNLRARRVVSGASTITMQLARLVAGSGRHWRGKVHQALWALRLERHLSKQQILEQYLNRVPLGQGAVGVPAAVQLYAGVTAARLSHGQAALLAGIARSPSSDNPLVSPAHARERRALALRRMVAAGFVSSADAERAENEPLVAQSGSAAFLAPHFTTRLVQQLEEASPPVPLSLKGEGGRMDQILTGGTIRTSLDLALQEQAEAEVRHAVDVLRDRNARHASAVVLDNRTGEILAWVGSPDFWADTMGQVDMVVSPRQPGSALKPFVYGLAFDRGYTPASVLPDVPRIYATATGPYRPRNYDRVYHGPARVREALASSFNVPAVELVSRLGAASALHTLRLAGFASLDQGADHYGLGVALGNGDVTLLEMANAYRTLANGGVWRPVRWLAEDRPAADSSAVERRVMTAGAAALVLDILADPVARLPGFGAGSALEFPFPVAAKTGTSRHFTDNWAVAVTERFTVAAWVGNFSGLAMRGVSGVTGAAPLVHRLVLATARRYAPGTLPDPESVGARRLAICRLSGGEPGPDCPGATEWFLPGTAPSGRCDWHRDGGVELPLEYAEWVLGAEGSASPTLRSPSAFPPLRLQPAPSAARGRGGQGESHTPSLRSGQALAGEGSSHVVPRNPPAVPPLRLRRGGQGERHYVAGEGSSPPVPLSGSSPPVPHSLTGEGSSPPVPLSASGEGERGESVAFRIVSPQDGDRYAVPPGTDPRYATIALRAAGQRPGATIRWFIDGRRLRSERWALVPGSHVVRAVTAGGARDEVRIEVR